MTTLVLDIETNLKHDQIWLLVTKDLDSGVVKCYREPTNELKQAIQRADIIIGHNLIAFDAPVLRKCWSIGIRKSQATDTLTLSRLLNPSIEGGHSLKAWGKRLKNAKIDFEVDDFDAGWTQEMQDYCIQDVELTADLYKYLCSEFDKWIDSGKQSRELEHEVQTICSRMERTGFKLDIHKASAFEVQISNRMYDIEVSLQKTFPPITEERWSAKTGKRLKDKIHTFNPGSRKQIAERLGDLGVKFTKKTEKGNVIIDDAVLAEIDIPEAKELAEYFLLQKRLGLVRAWLDAVGSDERVHGRIITCGAVTGRMTHMSPNMAQIPSVNSEYGAECREMWTVDEGRRLVGADLSGIELRCLAHYMQDSEYTEELLNGDIHTKTQNAAGLPTRAAAKTFAYATLYGAGPAKVGSIVSGGAKEGQVLIDRYLRNTPKLGILLEKVKRLHNKYGFLTGLDGRRVMTRSDHSALNTLLQSCGAIIAKQWCVTLHEKIKAERLDAKLVAFVHDELQLDCAAKDAERVGQLAVDSAAEAGTILGFRVPVGAEYSVGMNWKETH